MISISPQLVTVSSGGTVQFTTTGGSGLNSWYVPAGINITANGVFTAPSVTQETFTSVTAIGNDNSTATAFVTILSSSVTTTNAALIKNSIYGVGVSPPGNTITIYDSGGIVGHVQPGGSGQKLTDGTQQASTNLVAAVIVQPAGAADGNFIDAEEYLTYYGNAAGFSLLGE